MVQILGEGRQRRPTVISISAWRPRGIRMPFADGLQAVQAVRMCLDLQQHAGLSVSRAAQQLVANGLSSSVRAITTRVTFVNRVVERLMVHGIPASAALERALTAVREFHEHGPRPALWHHSARLQRQRLRSVLDPRLVEFWQMREQALKAARRPPLQQWGAWNPLLLLPCDIFLVVVTAYQQCLARETAVQIEEAAEVQEDGRRLFLALKGHAFDVMVTGEKPIEVRDATPYWTGWFTDRKTGMLKDYQYVTFSRGYLSKERAPRFVAKCRGIFKVHQFDRTYSTGFSWTLPYSDAGYYVILLGDIVSKSNVVPDEQIAPP